MSEDQQMSRPSDQDRELLLAYMRGELGPEEHARFVIVLAQNSMLREELEALETVAQVAQEEAAQRSTEAAFERFHVERMRQMTQGAHLVEPRSNHDVSAPGLYSRSDPHSRLATRRSRPRWQPLLNWMRRYAPMLQPALAILVVAQAAVIAHYAWNAAPERAQAPLVRGVQASCNDIWVTFTDGVSEAALRSWLSFYDASIAEGPDLSSRYRITTRDEASRAALLGSAEAARIVGRVEAPQGCSRVSP